MSHKFKVRQGEKILNISYIIIIIICYLIGSVQNGILLGKIFYKLDIRNFGSKSTGATNINRVLGIKPGVVVLILDILKGLIPIFIIKLIFDEEIIHILSSCFIVIGHCFPIYHRFKGGKGVATGFGSVIIHIPLISIALIPSLPIIYLTKYVSLGSVLGSLISMLLIFYLAIFSDIISYNFLYIGIVIPSIIIFKHRQNIIRIINNTENKITFNNNETK